jgi:hypothetical protein
VVRYFTRTLSHEKETTGRKFKVRKPIDASFGDVLKAIVGSKYKDEKTIKKKLKV